MMSEEPSQDNSIDLQLFDFMDTNPMEFEFNFDAVPEFEPKEAGKLHQDLEDFPLEFAYNSAPSHELNAAIPLQTSESANQPSVHNTDCFFSEQELVAQKEYLDNYGYSHTAGMTDLASQIIWDLEHRQRERLIDNGPANQHHPQPSVLAYNVANDDLTVETVRNEQTNQHLLPNSTVESPSVQNLGLQYGSGLVSQDGLNQLITPPAQQLRRFDLGTASQAWPKPNIAGVDALIAQAKAFAQQTRSTPSTDSGSRAQRRKPLQKPKAKKKSQPTPMQCAPLSVSSEPKEKRVNIDIDADGTARVILREGEDPNQPITFAECVARPRDEQLTRPRDGEPPIRRVRINSRRSRPPYISVEDEMTEQERIHRATRNQKIAELDHHDRRTRNNESARRTRERTKKTIADQAETIEQQTSQIQALQDQVTDQQQEISRLQAQLDQQLSGQEYR